LSTEFDRRHTTGVVNCCKQNATVRTCCLQSSSVVDDARVEQEAGQLLFAVRYFVK